MNKTKLKNDVDSLVVLVLKTLNIPLNNPKKNEIEKAIRKELINYYDKGVQEARKEV